MQPLVEEEKIPEVVVTEEIPEAEENVPEAEQIQTESSSQSTDEVEQDHDHDKVGHYSPFIKTPKRLSLNLNRDPIDMSSEPLSDSPLDATWGRQKG